MPFGTTVTSYIANLIPTDPLAPQVIGDFARALPPNPVKGELVSHFADSTLPPNPVHSSDVGSLLSDYIAIVRGPDLGGDGDIFI